MTGKWQYVPSRKYGTLLKKWDFSLIQGLIIIQGLLKFVAAWIESKMPIPWQSIISRKRTSLVAAIVYIFGNNSDWKLLINLWVRGRGNTGHRITWKIVKWWRENVNCNLRNFVRETWMKNSDGVMRENGNFPPWFRDGDPPLPPSM